MRSARPRGAVVLCVLALLLSGCGATRPAPSAPKATAIPTGSTTAPTATPLRLVGLGDSVMAGTHCGCSGIPAEYADRLAQLSGRRVVSTNLGANGFVTSDVLGALRDDPGTRRAVRTADVVLVEIGANDLLPQLHRYLTASCGPSCFRTPAEHMGDRLRQILTAVAGLRGSAPDTVLVADYWNVFRDGDVARRQGGQTQLDWSAVVTATANAAICRAAASTQARCVDLVAPFAGDGSGDPTRFLAADGDHPNAAGVRRIVGALMAATPRSVVGGAGS